MSLNSLAAVLSILLILLLTAAYSMPASKQQRTGGNKVIHKEGTDLESSLNISTTSEVSQLQTELASLSIHSYLKELYINLTYSNQLLLTNEEMEVSTVQSYKNQVKDAACGYYRFDVHKDTTDGKQIVQAELRLLQTNSPTLNGDYNVDIYNMESENRWSTLPISFKHIDSTPGWKIFDITPMVIKWKQGLVNHGLQVRLSKHKEILSCEGVFSEGEEDPLNTEPLLIVYANDHNTPTTSLKRDIISQRKEKRSPVDVLNNCHRKEMMVKADLIKRGNIQVLHPKSLDIGVCEGQCPSSMQANAGNLDDLFHYYYYALIFDLHYYNTKGSSIPSRCCVPTSFKKKVVMFYNETSGTHFLSYAPVLVEKCSCL